MLFNSVEFGLFFPIVLLIYALIGNSNFRAQNIFIILASYFFYAQWDWRFLSLIAFSTLIDYSVGVGFLHWTSRFRRRLLLWISLLGNLGILFYFKYFNFFVDSFIDVFRLFGAEMDYSSTSIILPVGISFYTFQTLSYTIDVYKGRVQPTTDFIAFASFVSFFPQLVAGPIERARNLLPQFTSERKISQDELMEGFDLILWGLFKKLVIADNVAVVVDQIYAHSHQLHGSTLFLGAVLFMIQLPLDFSGYSDIAIGVSRFFGIKLMRNFAYPHFSRDVAEAWSRWHISLTTWFRDYIYLPLTKGKKYGRFRKFLVVCFVFVLCGLWHGPSWNFLIWGLLFALMYAKQFLYRRKEPRTAIVAEGKLLPSPKELRQMLLTYLAVTLPAVFFRAESIEQAMQVIGGIVSMSLFSIPEIYPTRSVTLLILVFFSIEWYGRMFWSPLSIYNNKPFWVKWLISNIVIGLIWYYRSTDNLPFIYFQF